MLRNGFLCWVTLGVCSLAFAEVPFRAPEDGVPGTASLNGNQVNVIESGGWKFFEGDILLGQSAGKSEGNQAITVAQTGLLWPNATVPYVIDSALPNPNDVREAMRIWTEATGVRFVQRTTEANRLRFSRSTTAFTCSSWVGMQGGEQLVNMADGCGLVAALHEIGHALGLWHEQSRSDRLRWITIVAENIQKACIHNFDLPASSRDSGSYDFASIMHYGRYAFSKAGRPTIVSSPAGIPIGDVSGLSAGDIAAIRSLYGQPAKTYVSSFPEGQPFSVDGVNYTSRQAFDWAPGSVHTLSATDILPAVNDVRYRFGRWSDDGGLTHTVTASANTPFYTISYARQNRVTWSLTPVSVGRVDLSPASEDGFYAEDQDVLITGVAAEGSSFWRWTGIDMANEGTYLEDGSFAVGSSNPRYFSVNIPKKIQLWTSPVPIVTITTEPPNLWIEVDGNEMRAPILYRNVLADNWQPGSTHQFSIRRPIQTCRVLCEGDTRWVFRGWKQGGASSQTVIAPNGATTYTALFQKQYRVQTSPFPVAISVSPASADSWYDEGSTIVANVTPPAGSRFLEWTGQKIDLDLPGSSAAAGTGVCSLQAFARVTEPLFLQASYETPPNVPTPVFTAAGIVHAATFLGGALSPGEMVTIFGSDLGPAKLTAGATGFAGYVDNCTAQTRILFDGVPAPVLYTSTSQASVIVPYSVAGKSTVTVVAEYRGKRSTAVTVPVSAGAPGLFSADSTGRGTGIFLHADFTLVTSAKPAAPGEIVITYATGEGQTQPAGVDGAIMDGPVLAKPALAVSATVGGASADILYAGSAPGFVAGLLQVNLKIPTTVSGDLPVVLKVGTASSPGSITIPVR